MWAMNIHQNRLLSTETDYWRILVRRSRKGNDLNTTIRHINGNGKHDRGRNGRRLNPQSDGRPDGNLRHKTEQEVLGEMILLCVLEDTN